MSLWDEFKKLTHPYADRDDEYDDYDDEELPEEEPQPDPEPYRAAPNAGYGRPAAAPTMTASAPAPGRVVNINSGVQLQVLILKPERFEEAGEIATSLRDRKALVLNLEKTEPNVARRLVDFLSGCAYALDGTIKKIAGYTYLITPYTVGVVGGSDEEEKDSGDSTYF